MAEWKPYRSKIPKSTGRKPGDTATLKTVYHVIHLPTTRRILEDGRLRARLVCDESKLNRSRTCVTWLSANTWVDGSIYGNIQFAFDWHDIIGDRRVYWVEAITKYNPTAYRLLLTDRDLSHSKYVTEYDPETDKGPLRLRNDNWYWNDIFTSEFMLEADVSLSRCAGLRFISHHPNICRPDSSACLYKNILSERTGGQVLAYILGSDIDTANHTLLCTKQGGSLRLTADAQNGVSGIRRALGKKKDRFGGGIKTAASRRSVLRGALALHGAGQTQAAKELVSLLHSQEIFEKALVEIIEAHFGGTGYTLPN